MRMYEKARIVLVKSSINKCIVVVLYIPIRWENLAENLSLGVLTILLKKGRRVFEQIFEIKYLRCVSS